MTGTKLPRTIEEAMAGPYGGLYGEVVTGDTYRIRSLKFKPDLVFDIGANIGIFSRYIRNRFPEARIIAMEPDPNNCDMLRRFTDDQNMILLERALGSGSALYHGLTAVNGSGETYLSSGLGYPSEEMAKLAKARNGMEESFIPTITLGQLLSFYYRDGEKALIKIDCEGAENSIWMDRESMDYLRRIDYIAMELHDYALTGGPVHDTVVSVTNAALGSLERTHDCKREGVHFWATKK